MRKAVEEVYNSLLVRGFSASRYHAGLDDNERRKNQDDFLNDRKTVMVATNAFGMGIDKPNVSYVIHYNMPKNIESYYQEAGRAGRDGTPADCILLYNGRDVPINKYLITHNEDEMELNPAVVANNLELLKQMTFYATSSDCLRQRLIGYFGGKTSPFCGHCSNCLTKFEEIDASADAIKIISCILELKKRNRSFGKVMIIDVLCGNKNEKVRRFELKNLMTYGIIKDTCAQRIRAIIDYLINEGILVLEGDKYPTVAIGRIDEVFMEKRQLLIKLPKENR
jgi:ATP-dependent DNA helicase RecQ